MSIVQQNRYGLLTCQYARAEDPISISSRYASTSRSSDVFAPALHRDHPRPSMAAAVGVLVGAAVVGGESAGSFQWA